MTKSLNICLLGILNHNWRHCIVIFPPNNFLFSLLIIYIPICLKYTYKTHLPALTLVGFVLIHRKFIFQCSVQVIRSYHKLIFFL